MATGQVGNKPIIRIWKAVSGALLCTLPPFHKRGIADIAFSKMKRKIETAAKCRTGDNHLHAVWRDVEVIGLK